MERKAEYLSCYRDGLLNDVLPFWLRHGIDREHGGFFTALDRDGTVVDTDKSVWAQGRFTWLLARLYNTVEPRDEWLELAAFGIRFMREHCIDRDGDGRMWFHVTRKGEPIRKRRYAFSESFAAIAFAEYARAAGEGQAAEEAAAFYDRFVSHHTDSTAAPPKYTGTRPSKGLGFPMISLVTAQEMRQSIGHVRADERIDRAIEEMQRDFLKPELGVVMETVGPEGEIYDHFDGRMLNPGHAIEGAWFVLREAAHRENDPDLIRMGCRMLDWMWERGWDDEYGGILYFRDLYDRPLQEYWHDQKFWWPQNEAIIATLLAYLLTGDEKYADWHEQIHDWAHRHFPDPEFGEWYGYLHRDGRISTPLKGSLWKGPFHLPRMQLTCWQWLEAVTPPTVDA